jgi:hypothetical protein
MDARPYAHGSKIMNPGNFDDISTGTIMTGVLQGWNTVRVFQCDKSDAPQQQRKHLSPLTDSLVDVSNKLGYRAHDKERN